MTSETQKLIEELKKEIEKSDRLIHELAPAKCPKCGVRLKSYEAIKRHIKKYKHYGDYAIHTRPNELGYIFREYCEKKAQLQFAEKLIEAIRKDMKKIVKKEQEETKNLFRDWSHETIRRAVYRSAIENLFLEIIKILNEAIGK